MCCPSWTALPTSCPAFGRRPATTSFVSSFSCQSSSSRRDRREDESLTPPAENMQSVNNHQNRIIFNSPSNNLGVCSVACTCAIHQSPECVHRSSDSQLETGVRESGMCRVDSTATRSADRPANIPREADGQAFELHWRTDPCPDEATKEKG